MGSQEELQALLEELLESENVYYMPPEKVKMNYDAIRYAKSTIRKTYANNGAYAMRDCYEITVIAKLPDHPVIKKLLALPYCSYNRHYVAENLNHDVLTIYY